MRNIFCSEHSETIKNFVWRLLQTFGKQGVTFLIFITCAKLLSVYEFGVYNYVLSIIFLSVVLGDFGISVATSKYVAEYSAVNKDKLRHVLFNSGLIILILTLIISVFVLCFGRSVFGDKYRYVLYLLPLIFLIPVTSLYDGIYVGLKRFKLTALISLFVGLISLCFIYILIKRYDLVGALISQNLFYLLLFVALAIGYREFSPKLNKEVIREVGAYSLFLGIANVGIFLYLRFDIIILGLFNYINEIAFYELTNKVMFFLLIPWTVLSQTIAPDVTRAFYEKKIASIKARLLRYIRLSLLYGFAIAVAALLAIKPIVSRFLPKYDTIIFYIFFSIIMFVLPGRLLGSVVVNSFIIPTGNAKIITYINLIFGGFKILINLFLVIFFGAIGILISTVIMDYISVFIATYVFNKNINCLLREG